MKPGQIAPRRKASGLLERAWWVMRRRKEFILPVLLSAVATGGERDAESCLRRYLRALVLAGILRADTTRLRTRFHRYILARDLGREAPVYRIKSKTVFDPNSGEVIDLNKEKSHG